MSSLSFNKKRWLVSLFGNRVVGRTGVGVSYRGDSTATTGQRHRRPAVRGKSVLATALS